MDNLLNLIKESNDITKSLFLMVLSVPITFLIQCLFFFIIKVWKIFSKGS